jgi:hypothetical protein
MIEHPLAVGPIVIGITIGIVLRMLWVFSREKR